MNFRIYKLSEIISEIAMGPFGSNIKTDCFVDSGVPVLNGNNISGVKLREDSFKYVTEEKADSLGRANAYSGDIIVTHRGTLGQICYIPEITKYKRYIISQSQFRFRCNNKAINIYVVYYFHTKIGRDELLSNASQVGVPALARPTSTFIKLNIALPDIKTQERIVDILTSIDDKIELNNKINENLQHQAHALFKSWFVDFEPWGGSMPGTWSKASLIDIAEFINGLAMQNFRPQNKEESYPVLKIRELRQGFFDKNTERCTTNISNDYIVNNNEVIFSWSGSLIVDFWTGGKCGLNQHLFKVISYKYKQWFYYMWTKYHLNEFINIATEKTTTMGHIKREHLKSAVVFIPDKNTYNNMTSIIEPILKQTLCLRAENNHLSQLRDTLLPKLMSGEVDVSNIDL